MTDPVNELVTAMRKAVNAPDPKPCDLTDDEIIAGLADGRGIEWQMEHGVTMGVAFAAIARKIR